MNFVQEGLVEDGIFVLETGSLVLLLDVSEVTIVFEVKSFRHVKSFESLVSLDFVLLVHFHGSLGYDVAVMVDCSNVVMETINFFHINLLNVEVRIV